MISRVKYRTAGISIAHAKAGGFAELPRINQAELLGARPVRCHQSHRTQLPCSLAVALHRYAEAGDNEAVTYRGRRAAVAECRRRQIRCGRRGELDESKIRRVSARRELRMRGD